MRNQNLEENKKFQSQLRPHQQHAILSAIDKPLGRIVIPTGGGKTRIEAMLIDMAIDESRNTHLIIAPRIALLNQLMVEFRAFIGDKYLALAFHSGRDEIEYDSHIHWEENQTTNIKMVDSEIARSRRMNKSIIIFSTYHSMHKLTELYFDIVIADESQYVLSKTWIKEWKKIDENHARQKLCFTATEKHIYHEDGRGLNNEVVFGPLLYQVVPNELIKKGIIVEPRLHIMSYSTPTSEPEEYVVDQVTQITKYQMNLIKQKGMPYVKVLFAMRGTRDVQLVAENYKKIQKILPDHDIFTIVSNSKYGPRLNGKKINNRKEFMKKLREAKNAIICHYDILSEGIDVDGITGVGILRNMSKSKFIQTIGRAMRPYKADRTLKPFALISVPVPDGDKELWKQAEDIVEIMIAAGFEEQAENIYFTDECGIGLQDVDESAIPELDDIKNNMHTIIQRRIEEIIHDLRMKKIQEELALYSTIQQRVDFFGEKLGI